MVNDDISKYLSLARRYCSSAEKCLFDVRTYLYKRDADNETIDAVINILQEEQYLNEERYVQAYISDAFRFNKWGKIKIRQALLQKGISDKIIQIYLAKIDEEQYVDVLKNLLIAKSKTLKKKTAEENNMALLRFALSRGYEMEIIRKFVGNIFSDEM